MIEQRSDLTGFAALLGESLTSRVALLEQLLQGAHYPSVGQYKERLLAETISNFLPSTVAVGTGFVLFPHEDTNPPAADYHDPLNQSAFAISRQCDVLVYDTTAHPPIFRDRDFVVLRPDSVRAVIEVKGAISRRQLNETLDSFLDFGLKWRTTQQFYAQHSQKTTPAPGMYVMAWDFEKRSPNGTVTPRPGLLAQSVADFYSERVPPSEADGLPLLEALFVHNETEISLIFGLEDDEADGSKIGWFVHSGRFVRARSGTLEWDRDRTIASLLAALHYKVVESGNFNRFFSYADEVRNQHELTYEHDDLVWAWRNLVGDDGRQFTRDVPRNP